MQRKDLFVNKMKILVILNYYYPYISGLSEYARLLAEKFVSEGNQVTVLTANYDHLPPSEIINGVNVVRAGILFKISKGTISPQFIFRAAKMAKDYDVIHLHLPMLESGMITRLIKKNNCLATYHCDINLPSSPLNHLIVKIMDGSNSSCLCHVKKIAVTTIDYMMTSRVASKYPDKLVEVLAPIKEYQPVGPKAANEKKRAKKRIGFCGRIVAEKGLDVLLRAYAHLKAVDADLELVICGDYQNIAGGSVYPALREEINRQRLTDVVFLGRLAEEKMAGFYSSLDVFVLPSVNSLEAFGMVQVEAMFCGTPVVASDLPGVRTIVQKTGMGEISRSGDADDLAAKIAKVLAHPEDYRVSRDKIISWYGMRKIYERMREIYESR